MNKIISAFYLLGLWAYGAILRIAALFHPKAKLLCNGRKETWQKLKNYDNSQPCVWIHAASLGEFEQGRPIIEAIKKHNPDKKVVLTFYSPSGYEVRKNYNLADLICYLPADGPSNASQFIDAINPEKVIFVKYEFWHFFLAETKKRNIPLYGISMIFREQQPFFAKGLYGGWFIDMLKKFTHIYVQDKKSAELLDSIAISNHSTVGDTRFDRVKKVVESCGDVEIAQKFVSNADFVMVAGSSWEPDENVYMPYINNSSNNIKLIVATHEVHRERVEKLKSTISVKSFFFTNPPADPEKYNVMIVDTIGLLTTIYKYGQIAYVGGGFGKGIHNTLEPAAYGMPVIFGPKHKKFKEALDLIDCGGGFCVTTQEEFEKLINSLRNDETKFNAARKAAGDYVAQMCGATDVIMSEVFKINQL